MTTGLNRATCLGVLLGGVSLFSACSSSPTPLDSGEPSLLLGDPVTLLEDGALGLRYFPDEGISQLEGTPGVQLMVSAGISTYLVEGEDLTHLAQATEVVVPGAPGEFDNGYAGVSAVVRIDGTFYGFYHAEDHEDLPPLQSGIPGFYASIGLVTSTDGRSWTKRGQVITSSQPKSWTAFENQGDRGAGEPGAVLSKDGRYVFLYYTEHSRTDGRSVDICVARADLTAGPPLPGAFLKYKNGTFSEPGLGGKDSPIVIGPDRAKANAIEGHVVYSKSADRYLMIFGVDAWEERDQARPPTQSGLYSSWSKDGVAWSLPKSLIVDYGVPQWSLSLSWQGSVIFDDALGDKGYLLYAATPSWDAPPHYLVGRRISIQL